MTGYEALKKIRGLWSPVVRGLEKLTPEEKEELGELLCKIFGEKQEPGKWEP